MVRQYPNKKGDGDHCKEDTKYDSEETREVGNKPPHNRKGGGSKIVAKVDHSLVVEPIPHELAAGISEYC